MLRGRPGLVECKCKRQYHEGVATEEKRNSQEEGQIGKEKWLTVRGGDGVGAGGGGMMAQ